jgi:AcrR family transcriptional regulator
MKPKTAEKSDSTHPKRQNESTRERVLEAAFTLFCEHGFSDVSMLEIATRAQVSKRDLYALFRNKQAVLADCIKERARRLRGPLDEADQAPKNREALAATLVEIGVSILKGVCQPEVLTVYRLTISESDRAPEIARLLDRNGREATRKALTKLLTKAQAKSFIVAGKPADLATRYFAILWDDLLIRLLMRLREPPTDDEIRERAHRAAETLL